MLASDLRKGSEAPDFGFAHDLPVIVHESVFRRGVIGVRRVSLERNLYLLVRTPYRNDERLGVRTLYCFAVDILVIVLA